MPIILEKEWQIGWKHKNKNDPVLVIKFINQKTNKLLFTYAPKYKDKQILDDLFAELAEYEEKKKVKKSKGKVNNCDPNIS